MRLIPGAGPLASSWRFRRLWDRLQKAQRFAGHVDALRLTSADMHTYQEVSSTTCPNCV